MEGGSPSSAAWGRDGLRAIPPIVLLCESRNWPPPARGLCRSSPRIPRHQIRTAASRMGSTSFMRGPAWPPPMSPAPSPSSCKPRRRSHRTRLRSPRFNCRFEPLHRFAPKFDLGLREGGRFFPLSLLKHSFRGVVLFTILMQYGFM